MKEPQSFFSQQQDRLRYIVGIKPTPESLALYRSVLKERGVLIDTAFPSFTASSDAPSKFEQAFYKNYTDLFGQEALDRFFASFSTDNVFVLKAMEYERVVRDWIGFDGAGGTRAVYHPDAHVIFVKEAPATSPVPQETYLEARLLEEVLHEFLDSEVEGGVLHNIWKRFQLSRERRGALQADFYENIPEEQIVKAMKLTVAEDMFDYPIEDLFPFTDFFAAEDGAKRMESLGKNKILQGRWRSK